MPLLVIGACLTVAAACTTITYESYRPVKNPNVDIVYVGANVDFGKYRRLMPEEMGIFYPKGGPAPSAADLQRVREAFRREFVEQVAGYEIVTRPGPDVIKVSASLVDLRRADAEQIPNLRADLNRILEPGKLTFLVEMRDSTSNTLLLRAADTQKSPLIDLPEGGNPNTNAIDSAARHWAQLFRNFLDHNLGS